MHAVCVTGIYRMPTAPFVDIWIHALYYVPLMPLKINIPELRGSREEDPTGHQKNLASLSLFMHVRESNMAPNKKKDDAMVGYKLET